MAGRGFFTNKSGKTGTVPKVKYRNNSSQPQMDNNHLSNNLVEGDFHHLDLNYSGNNQRNRQILSSSTHLLPRGITDSSFSDNYPSLPRANGTSSLNMAANPYHSTPGTSATNSRRNSTGTVPKCDNVSRYPDKKQIEDKLEQIREYLRVTSTLMMSIQNGEDRLGYDQTDTESLSQMIQDLKDSEAKLITLLKQECEIDESTNTPNLEEDNRKTETNMENPPSNNTNSMQRKELEQNVEQSNQNLQMLREQQNTLLMLQQKAENQLRDARDAQDRLVALHNAQEQASANRLSNLKTSQSMAQNSSIQSIPEQLNIAMNAEMITHPGIKNNEREIRSIEERLKSLQVEQQQPPPLPPQLQLQSSASSVTQDIEAEVDRLREKIGMMHDSNEGRHQLLDMLDNRDAQLSSEHMALQGKLHELQSKKSQIDQLVLQLQHMNDEPQEDGHDVAQQVRNIVSMKDQLTKLKDMLEVVKATESRMESQNFNDEFQNEEEQDMNMLYTNSNKPDNIAQGVYVKGNHNYRAESSNPRRSNERWVGPEKQSNKTSASISRERQQMLLQAELQAKKQELEELMYKDQDRTSNINQDVCSEISANKSEPTGSGIFDSVPSSWFMVSPQRNRPSSRENVYSSDEAPEEDLDYTQLNTSLPRGSSNMNYSLPTYSNCSFRPLSEASNVIRTSDIEPRNESKPHVEFPRTQSSQYITNLQHTPRSTRSASIPTPTVQDTNANTTEQNKIHKQLELITNLCQSLLEQQTNLPNCGNNLSPSPLYLEPRPFASPTTHSMNALNVVNPGTEVPWMGQNSVPPPWFAGQPGAPDVAYPNLLTANTLQTQALMLSTLNQCCQMLWHQQREMNALRTSVQMMQDRVPNYEHNIHTLSPYSNMTNYLNPPVVTLSSTQSNQNVPPIRPTNQPKLNPAHASSMASASAQMSIPHNDSQSTNSDVGFCFPSATNLNNSNLVLNHQNMTGDPVLHLTTNANNSTVFDNGQSNLNRTLPSQAVWGGTPALNNQVPPGNRANNYWDNFRSYSRQNLLSTSAKRNEISQNTLQAMDRANNSSERSFSVAGAQSGPKLNTTHHHHDSQENVVSQRRAHSDHSANRNMPSEGALMNHHTKTNDNLENPVFSLHSFNQLLNSETDPDEHHMNSLPNLSLHHHHHDNEASNISDDPTFKMQSSSRRNNHNEWHNEEIPSDSVPIKSKLFEVLREPIYKEVASLISANVNRPHFLIQLFRDLQMISSDPLRNSTLQSIQSVITNSLSSTPESNSLGASTSRQSTSFPQQNEQELLANSVSDVAQSNGIDAVQENLLPPTVELNIMENNENDFHLSVNVQQILVQVLSYLKSHKEDIFQISIIDAIKSIILKLIPTVDILSHVNLKQYTNFIINQLDTMLTETLVKYQGKRVHEIKEDVLKEMADILLGELTFLKLLSTIDQPNIADALKSREVIEPTTQLPVENNLPLGTNSATASSVYNLQVPLVNHVSGNEDVGGVGVINEVVNGDLAEADQSQIESEEGAIGGIFIPSTLERDNENVVSSDEVDVPKIDFPVSNAESENELAKQGLDQVPTRLTKRGGRSLRSASHSPTKRRDRSLSHSDTAEHY